MPQKILLLFLLILISPVQAAVDIQAWTLDNGAKVFLVENHDLPMLDLNIDFDAGSRRDAPGKSGLAGLTNAMLARGVRAARLDDGTREPALSEAEISDGFADIAAERGGGASADRAGASLRTLSSAAERDRAVQLLARLLAQPALPQDFLARDKARTIAAIKEELTRPASLAERAFWRLAYGEHPYAATASVESVTAVTREDLQRFHTAHYVANRAVVTFVGDVSRQQAEVLARELTKRLPQGQPLPNLPPVPAPVAKEEWIAHPATQAHILLGEPALTRGDPDYFALLVGNYALGGGGFVSRLMQEVREKRGLAYGAYGYFNPMAQRGPYMISLQTQKDQADEALKVVHAVLADFLATGPTEQELQAAKDNLIGGFALRLDSNSKILDNVAMIGYYGMPLDYLDTWTDHVAQTSIEQIKVAFNRKVSTQALTTVVVGAQEKP